MAIGIAEMPLAARRNWARNAGGVVETFPQAAPGQKGHNDENIAFHRLPAAGGSFVLARAHGHSLVHGSEVYWGQGMFEMPQEEKAG